MKFKFNSFLDDIVTRPSVAYAAFVSYFFLIVPLLGHSAFIFNLYANGIYATFFSLPDGMEFKGLYIILLIYLFALPLLIIILLLIFTIPTYKLYRKEKDINFRLKHKPIYDSSLYRSILFSGIILFAIWVIVLFLANPIYIFFFSKEFGFFNFILTIIFFSLPALGVFIITYIPFQIGTFLYAIYNIFVLLFTFRA